MVKTNKISLKIILAISAIWLPFLAADIYYDMRSTKDLVITETQRWGNSTGQTIRIALNALMREGKMDARFSLFQDLSNELTELESVRVIRSPKVNEIFMRVRIEKDIPREEENILLMRDDIVELLKNLDVAEDPYEKSDIQDSITEISFEINQAMSAIDRYKTPMTIDPREAARNKNEKNVLKTGIPYYQVDGDAMQIIVPYKVRKTGCAEASGCHFYAEEGDILGAVDMKFSIKNINEQSRQITLSRVGVKALASFISLLLIYLVIDLIVIRNINRIRNAMKNMQDGNLDTRIKKYTPLPALLSRNNPNKTGGDELDYLMSGFNSMAEKLEKTQQELQELATHDGLTGLYNRRYFSSALDDEIMRSQRFSHPLSLLMVDLDNFKAINDTYGHPAGDIVLCVVSNSIQAGIRTIDIPARYGGEEFVIILPETDIDGAMNLAERLRIIIAKRNVSRGDGVDINVTASIGVTTILGDNINKESLIQTVDKALYKAKESGRNCITFLPTHNPTK